MTKWMLKCGLAASLALTVSMVGCKDDDDDGNGNGDTDAGTDGGQQGQDASTGGDAGTDAAQGVTVEECTENTTALQVPEVCASCVCEADVDTSNDCATTEGCWPLIQCVNANCPGLEGQARTECAGEMCDTTAGLQALLMGMVIEGSCAAECGGGSSEDGGVGDAGDEDAGDEDAGDEDAATDEDAGTDGG